MVKFLTSKKIINPKKNSALKEENSRLIKFIREGYTTAQLIQMGYKRRRINGWQQKIRNGYNENYRKVRTPKPKVDNVLVQNFFNFDINNIINENDKEFIDYCLNVVNSNNFKNSNEQQKNILLKRCGICGKAGNDEIMLFCDKCDDGFHKKCVDMKEENFRCKRCISETKVDSTDVYKTIKIYSIINKEVKGLICNEKLKIPTMKKLENLDECLKNRNLQFNDDLVYSKNCPKEVNNYLLENGIQKLSEKNVEIYNKFKKESRLGNYGPFKIEEDLNQGYVVKAKSIISPNTIISEYSGDVFFLRDALFMKKNDSAMELIHSPTSDTSLVIIPVNYGNLGRFLSGVNNTKKNLKEKNVYSIRVNIEGSIHVLLLASRKINKGEILYYDYNAGGYNNYNTSNFK